MRLRFGVCLLFLAFPVFGYSQSTLNFPKFFSSAELPVSGFAIVNPNTTTATVTFKLYSASGQVISSKDQSYGPGTQLARSGNEIFSTLGSGGWVQATSTTTGLAGFWLNYDGAVTFIDGAEAATSAIDQVIPLVAGTTELNIANTNSNATPNPVTIRLFGESSELGTAVTQNIVANGVLQANVASLFPTANISNARYVRVTGVLPVAACALLRGYLVPRDTAVVNGSDRSSTLTQMNFPHVISGIGFGGNYTTEVGVTNLSSSAQTVTVSFTPEAGGSALNVTRQLAANGALRETAQSLFGFDPNNPQNGWIRVTGTAPIAGFVAYADSVAGGVAVVSVQALPRFGLLFAHIADLPPFSTGLAVLNTNPTAANVTVSSITPDGVLIGTTTFSLAPNTKTAKLLSQLTPQTKTRTNDGGFISVSSNQPLYGIELFFNGDLSSISNVAGAPALGFTPPGPAAPLSLTSIAPTRAAVGATLTLSGAGFSTNASSNTIVFTGASGGVSAAASTASATSLTVTVPNGAITGPVFVQAGGQSSTSIVVEVLATATSLQQPASVSVNGGATTTGVDIYVPPAAAGLNVTGIGISDTNATSVFIGSSSVDVSRGQTKRLALSGTGIAAGNASAVSISGDGITLGTVQFNSGLLLINITVSASATLGPRNVIVTNSNLDTSVLSGGIFIR